ncbi:MULTISPECIES: hypothetical protein [Vibrio]|uniref:Uncharacterized protein n=1 Tax=Vibrio tasmaniensis TaxID=212663 RepID=A0A2N7NCU8_9VIBR|nr:hypothetical protein [Vibrio tasmaniensis]PMO89803.1 hypothetical protein BCT01_00545 [Vibrio tasmaniensis]PMP10024.1 hypothetical protein BCS92_02545 [Vibrio tasmaniensis]TKG32594.1 hypothetical protein FC057_12315 [Vibrio tasmaniensis]TKG41723.1 hypothetical protein FC063_07625 [Vibrio tasmaniensis]TKG52078.1 hypothetical protein FC070_09895 [Vibrio tasmaniensis]
MRYLLVTGHKYPKFYKVDGSIVEIELNYVDEKVFSSMDETGKLTHRQIGGTQPCVDGHWLVDSVEEALSSLETKDVYPFVSKAAAKENAKRLGLKTFKYIAVP